MGYSEYSAIGSTHSGVIPVMADRFMGGNGDNESDIHPDLSDKEAIIVSFGRKFADMEERGRYLEEYRGDTLSDISAGLNMLSSGIKVITTILSLFGADTVDRYDG